MFAVICQEESVLSLKNSSPEALRVVREGGETLSNTRGNSEVNLEQTVFGYTYIDNVSTLRSCAVYELTFPQ